MTIRPTSTWTLSHVPSKHPLLQRRVWQKSTRHHPCMHVIWHVRNWMSICHPIRTNEHPEMITPQPTNDQNSWSAWRTLSGWQSTWSSVPSVRQLRTSKPPTTHSETTGYIIKVWESNVFPGDWSVCGDWMIIWDWEMDLMRLSSERRPDLWSNSGCVSIVVFWNGPEPSNAFSQNTCSLPFPVQPPLKHELWLSLLAGMLLGLLADSRTTARLKPFVADMNFNTVAIALMTTVASLRTFSQNQLLFSREARAGLNKLAHCCAVAFFGDLGSILKGLCYLSLYYSYAQPRALFSDFFLVTTGLIYSTSGFGYLISKVSLGTPVLCTEIGCGL